MQSKACGIDSLGPMSKPGGLVNGGSLTCYANTTLQMLAGSARFRERIKSGQGTTVDGVLKIFHAISTSEVSYNPLEFLTPFFEKLKRKEHQDPGEFLALLKGRLAQEGLTFDDGVQTSEVQCMQCDNPPRNHSEPFSVIAFNFPQDSVGTGQSAGHQPYQTLDGGKSDYPCQEKKMWDLADLLRIHLDAPSGLTCQNCQSELEETRSIILCPVLLVLQLDPFTRNGIADTKVSHGLRVPKTVSLPVSGSTIEYSLCGIAVHKGESRDLGHYYAIRRDISMAPEKQGVSRREIWYKCDDENVTVFPGDLSFRSCAEDSPYMFLYERDTSENETISQTPSDSVQDSPLPELELSSDRQKLASSSKLRATAPTFIPRSQLLPLPLPVPPAQCQQGTPPPSVQPWTHCGQEVPISPRLNAVAEPLPQQHLVASEQCRRNPLPSTFPFNTIGMPPPFQPPGPWRQAVQPPWHSTPPASFARSVYSGQPLVIRPLQPGSTQNYAGSHGPHQRPPQPAGWMTPPQTFPPLPPSPHPGQASLHLRPRQPWSKTHRPAPRGLSGPRGRFPGSNPVPPQHLSTGVGQPPRHPPIPGTRFEGRRQWRPPTPHSSSVRLHCEFPVPQRRTQPHTSSRRQPSPTSVSPSQPPAP